MLAAFSEVLGLNLAALTRWELRHLPPHIDLYNHMAELYEDHQNLPVETEILPRLSLQPDSVPEDTKQRFVEAVEQYKGNTFWNVLELLSNLYMEA